MTVPREMFIQRLGFESTIQKRTSQVCRLQHEPRQSARKIQANDKEEIGTTLEGHSDQRCALTPNSAYMDSSRK